MYALYIMCSRRPYDLLWLFQESWGRMLFFDNDIIITTSIFAIYSVATCIVLHIDYDFIIGLVINCEYIGCFRYRYELKTAIIA
jgi:hypothetical protein